MALAHSGFIEPRCLELTIDITGEHERTMLQALTDFTQEAKAVMRNGVSVELKAVSVKAPGESRIGSERGRVGDLLERDFSPAKCRIGAPKAVGTAKIRQAGIHPHAGTGAN